MTIPGPPAHLHFVGIGGIGVSGLARLLRARGYNVSGSDMIASDITESLEGEGIKVAIGHDAGHVEGADVVITTAAAKADNVELVAAAESGISVVKRAAVLGLLARDFRHPGSSWYTRQVNDFGHGRGRTGRGRTAPGFRGRSDRAALRDECPG